MCSSNSEQSKVAQLHGSIREGARREDGHQHTLDHEAWSRRQFIKGLALAGSAVSLGLHGMPVHAAQPHVLAPMLMGMEHDRVLVLIQLSGGNDGLNMVVPIGNDLYYRRRPNLGLSGSKVLSLSSEVGLNARMQPLEALYGDGTLSIVQDVGYPNSDLSHFVSTDVWLSGQPVTEQDNTGWMGRTLASAFPEALIEPLDYPLAIQIGSSSPMLFQADGALLGTQFPSQSMLDRLTSTGSIYDESDVPSSLAGAELAYARGVANDSFIYAGSIKDAYSSARNLISYPGGTFASQLASVARMIRGGMKSRVYHVSLGGFDTHSYQEGTHGYLLSVLAAGLSAFMDDLRTDGLHERVLAMTFSEFGRRVEQNGSIGTDHGTSAPLFIAGGHVLGGLHGDAPDLADLDVAGNLKPRLDFRSVYASVLQQWFGLSESAVSGVLGGAYPTMPVIHEGAVVGRSNHGVSTVPEGLTVSELYPNPTTGAFTVTVRSLPGRVDRATLLDLQGRNLGELDLTGTRSSGGDVTLRLDVPAYVPSGRFFVRIQSGGQVATKGFVLVR